MRIFRHLAAGFAATVLSISAMLFGASPAQAVDPSPTVSAVVADLPRPSSCASVSVCGYGDNYYRTGQGYEYIPTLAAGRYENVGLNDLWSSVWNSSGRTIRLFKNANCTGTTYMTIPNGRGNEVLGYGDRSWDNSVSCVKFV